MYIVRYQIAQRDIMNSIDREMSGDLKNGFKCIGIMKFLATSFILHGRPNMSYLVKYCIWTVANRNVAEECPETGALGSVYRCILNTEMQYKYNLFNASTGGSEIYSVLNIIPQKFAFSHVGLFCCVVQCSRNPAVYFAERLWKSMKGVGTNDSLLIRIVVSRSEVGCL